MSNSTGCGVVKQTIGRATRPASDHCACSEAGLVHHTENLARPRVICNCCSCCCGAMSAHAHGTPMVVSSGYIAQIDTDACRGCGTCAQVCPFGAVQMFNQPQVQADACMGCGVCTHACPAEACRLVRDEDKPLPLEVPG